MDDEPLGEWAERRDQHRPRIGERRATPLGGLPRQGTHVDPEAPRGMQVWNGHAWVPEGVAEDRSAADEMMGDDAAACAERVPLPTICNLPPAPTNPYRPTIPFHRHS
ncbi:DUF6087 family protein [Streptomyces sp. NPDC127037]|uniref:DUF6087 family protein n=1 Tax=Streptomyces sp. NPDC127037 TaxID=3347113 RepID=UPI003662DA2C